jgi:hypothetical protein
MIAAWLLFPVVMLAVCLGAGLAVDWATGSELPGTIVISVGLALIMVVATLTTSHAATASVTTPVVLVLAVAGFVFRRRRVRRMRPDPWAGLVGVGVFCVCAAPVVLSGNATFLGYFVLNDGVFHFSLIHQLLAHGHDVSALPPSSYSVLLKVYLSTSYPTGADLPIGVLRPLVGQDVAWLFQPYMAVIMGLGGAAIYELLLGVVASRPLRALSAFVAAQAGLVYAYYLQASIKEVATTWIITVTVVLVVTMLRRPLRWRMVIPLIVVTVAGVDLLGLAIAPWLAPPLAVFVGAAGWRVRHVVARLPRKRLAIAVPGAVVVLAGLGVVAVHRASTYLTVAQSVLTQPGDLGNLFSPLPKWEMFGIWPVGDFRLPVVIHHRLAYALIGIALASGALGILWAIRRRKLAPLLLLAGDVAALVYLLSRASPYASGKVMMIFSLAAVVTAMLGPMALHNSGRRIAAWGLSGVIAAGVLWTNALGYHDASVAPRARLQELSSIDTRFSGQGPAFYNLSDEYATYFLRDLAPSDPALGPPVARTPSVTPTGRQPWDTDALSLGLLQTFRLLVIGNGALTSRPPSDFQLVYHGRFYDVWKRVASPHVLAHVPLGSASYPAAVPRCGVVRSVAAQARRAGAQIAYVARPQVPMLVPTSAARPHDWGEVGGDPLSVIPRGDPGVVTGNISVPTSGRYDVAVDGSLSQKMGFLVDGRRVGSVSYELGPPGQITPVGSATLNAGTHRVTVVRPPNNLTPGDGGIGRLLGPVVFLHGDTLGSVSTIAFSQARRLCGESLDWIEIVR